MWALKGLIALAAIVAASPACPSSAAGADEVARWAPHIAEASTRFGVPSSWIAQVMRAESRGRTQLGGRPIRSVKGAMGLMQLMPGTWTEMRARLGLGNDPDEPRDNILAGTFYLRLLYDRFGYPGLFAAYNAGPSRYEKHLAGVQSLPAETRSYLAQVAAGMNGAATDPGPRIDAPARHTMFIAIGRGGSDGRVTADDTGPDVDPMFAVRAVP